VHVYEASTVALVELWRITQIKPFHRMLMQWGLLVLIEILHLFVLVKAHLTMLSIVQLLMLIRLNLMHYFGLL